MYPLPGSSALRPKLPSLPSRGPIRPKCSLAPTVPSPGISFGSEGCLSRLTRERNIGREGARGGGGEIGTLRGTYSLVDGSSLVYLVESSRVESRYSTLELSRQVWLGRCILHLPTQSESRGRDERKSKPKPSPPSQLTTTLPSPFV